MSHREKGDVHVEALVPEANFLRARQKVESGMPIRPNGDEHDVRAVEMREMDQAGIIWWGAPEPEQGPPEGERRHPEKAWADMGDSEPDEEEMDEDEEDKKEEENEETNERNQRAKYGRVPPRPVGKDPEQHQGPLGQDPE